MSKVTLPTQHDAEKFAVQLNNVAELKSIFTEGKLDALQDAEASPISIASQYFDFKQGQEERFIFVGIVMRESQDREEEMPAITIVDKNGDTFINQATILVDAFISNNIEKGTAVAITWRDTKKTGKGNMVRTWSVKPLSL